MSSSLLQLLSVFLLLRATLTDTRHPLILILLDGFRWDYTEVHGGDEGLRGFEEMAKEGTRATHLNPVFPTNSFPNWHTIVTGLYPESHGIVSNYMMDLDRNLEFVLENQETTGHPGWWSAAEPLWITATKHNLKTALFQWSRCDVQWESKLPKHCEPFYYDAAGDTANFTKRLTRALSMIQHDNYDLIMVYEGGVDTLGHKYGPQSSQVNGAVQDVDAALHKLWQDMDNRDMLHSTNVVVVSDHGMTGTQPGQLEEVDVGGCVAGQLVEAVLERGGFVNIRPAPGHIHKVVEAIRECPGVKGKVDVYTKEEVPHRYHYRNNRLIHQVVLIARPGYSISLTGKWEVEKMKGLKGNHGYDDTLGHNPDMRGILYARGPAFAKGVETNPVNQVDVYGLLCRALALPSRPNNGTLAHVAPFFATDPTHHQHPHLVIATVTLSLLTLFLSLLFLKSGKFGASLRLK